MALSNEELKKYGEQLKFEREKLEKEIEEHEKLVDFGGDIEDEDEEADEAEETGNQLAISRALRNRLEEIKQAQEDMASGKYGICKKCGRPISSDVLFVAPESQLCKDCKKGEQR